MRLLLLGATGGTGLALLEQARGHGHQVTAFVRSPQKLGASRDGVDVWPGDPRSAAELRAALPGHDAVVSTLGPPGPGRSTILREGARSTVAAMQAVGPRRLLVVSAAVLFENAGILATILRRTLLRNLAEDAAEMEHIVVASDLDWTIVRAPRLTNGPLTASYRVENGRLPAGRGLASISRADVAHFLMGELARGAHAREIVGMAGTRSR